VPDPLRVVLADDSYLVREGTRSLLVSTGEVEVLAAVGSATELVYAVDRLAPHAVLTDVRMPPENRTDGIIAAKDIRSAHPTVGVVVLSQHANEGYLLQLIEDGAEGLGYLLKERVGDRRQLVNALRETAAGGSVIDPILVDALVRRQRLNVTSPLGQLTPRELDVLRTMALGKSNSAIAEELHLSQSSIEKHVNAIFTKLTLTEEPSVHRRVAAVVTFLRERGI
jgi:DNA-binding NarL/FixJ family response regulator